MSINSSTLSEPAWQAYREELATRLGLPVCDPMRTGVAGIVDALLR